MEDDLKKNENGRRPQSKRNKNGKKRFQAKLKKSTLIGCDITVN